MPAKIKPDDFLDMIKEQRVIDEIGKSLMSMISLCIEEAIDKKLNALLNDIVVIKKDNISLHAEVNKLHQEVTELHQSELEMKTKLEALEA